MKRKYKLLILTLFINVYACKDSTKSLSSQKNQISKRFSKVLVNDSFLTIDSSYNFNFKNLTWDRKKMIIRKLVNYFDSTMPSIVKPQYYGTSPSACSQIFYERHFDEYSLCTEALFLINIILFDGGDDQFPSPLLKREYMDSSFRLVHPQKNVISHYKIFVDSIESPHIDENKARQLLKKDNNFWLNCYY